LHVSLRATLLSSALGLHLQVILSFFEKFLGVVALQNFSDSFQILLNLTITKIDRKGKCKKEKRKEKEKRNKREQNNQSK
jgi:hypothetical protein